MGSEKTEAASNVTRLFADGEGDPLDKDYGPVAGPKTRTSRRPATRAFVLAADGSSADVYWSPIPDWVACRLAERKVSAAAWACALALGRMIRQRSGENPTKFSERRREMLGCVPRGHTRGRGLRELMDADVVTVDRMGERRAPLVLSRWLSRG